MTAEQSVADRLATPADWRPEFPGQRPALGPGNTAALRNGVHSPRVFGPRADQIAAELLADRPDLAAPSYRAAVGVHCVFLARFELELAKDEPSDFWLTKLGSAVLRSGAALGLDPTSEARLTRDRAAAAAIASSIDLGALAARGQAALDARGMLTAPAAAPPTEPHDLDPEAATEHDGEDD